VTRATAVDLCIVGGVALAVVGGHVALPGVESLRPGEGPVASRMAALVTSTVVHRDWPHLLTNLAGYAVGTAFVYALCIARGWRRYFYAVFVSVVLGVPAMANALTFYVYSVTEPETTVVSIGFSDVVSGFVGVLLVVSFFAFRSFFTRRTLLFVGWLYAFVSLGAFAWLHVRTTALRTLIGLGALLAAAGVVWSATHRGQLQWRRDPAGSVQPLLVVLAGLCIWVAFLAGLFPSRGGAGIPQVDFVGHSVGLFIGAGLALNWAYYFELDGP
jgi:membrane associated rhomboid family serine protease